MRAPAKPKPRTFEEVARVLAIARLIAEELSTDIITAEMVAVAERIAARTED